MEYRKLPSGNRISAIGIGVGNYGYENITPAEAERIFCRSAGTWRQLL